jgi:hypothetical protein
MKSSFIFIRGDCYLLALFFANSRPGSRQKVCLAETQAYKNFDFDT